jgi:hypothetical protein
MRHASGLSVRLEVRERVVEAVNEGATRLEAAERFGVSVSSAVR